MPSRCFVWTVVFMQLYGRLAPHNLDLSSPVVSTAVDVNFLFGDLAQYRTLGLVRVFPCSLPW
jgi:hypothetical protein